MPITKSAKKSLRVSLKKRERNLVWKKKVESATKAAKKAISSKDSNVLKKVSEAYQILDKGTKKRIISAGRAARIKSRLAKTAEAKEKFPKVKKSVENKPATNSANLSAGLRLRGSDSRSKAGASLVKKTKKKNQPKKTTAKKTK